LVDWSESIRSTPVSPFSGCTSRILNTMGPRAVAIARASSRSRRRVTLRITPDPT
jgi:hypothetical protein